MRLYVSINGSVFQSGAKNMNSVIFEFGLNLEVSKTCMRRIWNACFFRRGGGGQAKVK